MRAVPCEGFSAPCQDLDFRDGQVFLFRLQRFLEGDPRRRVPGNPPVFDRVGVHPGSMLDDVPGPARPNALVSVVRHEIDRRSTGHHLLNPSFNLGRVIDPSGLSPHFGRTRDLNSRSRIVAVETLELYCAARDRSDASRNDMAAWGVEVNAGAHRVFELGAVFIRPASSFSFLECARPLCGLLGLSRQRATATPSPVSLGSSAHDSGRLLTSSGQQSKLSRLTLGLSAPAA